MRSCAVRSRSWKPPGACWKSCFCTYVLLDRNGVIQRSNHLAEDLFQFRPNGLPGKQLQDFILAQQRPRLQETLTQVRQYRQPQQLEVRYAPFASNRLRWLRLTCSTLVFATDEEWLLCALEDTTAQRRYHDNLLSAQRLLKEEVQQQRQANTKLQTIFEAMPGSILVVDKEMRIIDLNARFCQDNGIYDRQALLGKPYYEVLYNRKQPCATCPLCRALQQGTWEQEEQVSGSEDPKYYFRCLAAPLRDDQQQIWGALELCLDISDLKQTEQALARARDAAQDASAAKSRFLATMSHEVRTPLNAIIGLSDITLQQPLTDDQRERLETIEQAGL